MFFLGLSTRSETTRIVHDKRVQLIWVFCVEGPLIIIIIIIISIFIEDNVFSTTVSLPYGPLVNTDIDYFRTSFVIIRTFSY